MIQWQRQISVWDNPWLRPCPQHSGGLLGTETSLTSHVIVIKRRGNPCLRSSVPQSRRFNPPPPGLFLYPPPPGGGEADPTPVLSRKRMVVERCARRHSKELDETLPSTFEYIKLRSRVRSRSGQRTKSGVFRLRTVETSSSICSLKTFHMYSQGPCKGTG